MWWQENMFQVNPVKRKTEEVMSDYIVRAMAGDGQIRAFAATTREMVETAKTNHSLSPVVTAALGRLLTAGAMMGITLKGEKDLLTLQVKGEGPVKGLCCGSSCEFTTKSSRKAGCGSCHWTRGFTCT